jgi:cytochrome d ubiquinol oxidase subunit I
MSFQFGTNWPGFMETVGNIAGPLLAYEILTAFFLEAAFLGIMLFGFSRVPGWMHTGATFLVAFGTTLSAFWILVLNSWMHTPTGFEMREGVAHATDWLAIIFNPSMPYRLAHTLLASGLTVAFLVAGVSALRLLMGDRASAPRLTLKVGVFLGVLLIPLQIFMGDLHGLNTLEHQPQKVAAMEGNWETRGNVPLVLFALPDEEARENRFELSIPNMASIILKHDPAGVVPGLNDFVAEDGTVLHPPVAPVFWSFRVMVGTGFAMLGVAFAAGVVIWRRGVDALPRPALIGLAAMSFSGWVATLAGWYTTEIGRQPWVVSGVLSTRDAVADVPAPLVAGSLTVYLGVYVVLLAAYVGAIVHMARKASRADGVAPAQGAAPTRGAAVAVAIPAE